MLKHKINSVNTESKQIDMTKRSFIKASNFRNSNSYLGVKKRFLFIDLSIDIKDKRPNKFNIQLTIQITKQKFETFPN